MMIVSMWVLPALFLFQDPSSVAQEMKAPTRLEFAALSAPVQDPGGGVGFVLEIYDVRDLTEDTGAQLEPSLVDLRQLVIDNLGLVGGQVHAVARNLVLRAPPADQRRMKDFLLDLRRFAVSYDVAVVLGGTLVQGSGETEGEQNPDLGGVRILSLSGAEVAEVEAYRHAADGRVSIPTQVQVGVWSLTFVSEGKVMSQGGPLAEGKVLEVGNAVDRVWLVGHELVRDVVGHPDGILAPRFETLSEGVRVEVSYTRLESDRDVERLKVSVIARQSRVIRPVPARSTEQGEVHNPESETAMISATLVLESGGGFVIVFEGEEEGAAGESVLVSVSRHESE